MKILVTGGLGFIGSHTVVALNEASHDIVIIDNLINSQKSVLNPLTELCGKEIPFYEGDVQDLAFLETVFKNHSFDGIIHFAALKAVGESVLEPLKYYDNNLNATMALVKMASTYHVPHLVFSSSATVYGDQPSPLKETFSLLPPTNPYGATKQMSESILKDVARSSENFKVTLLRYFNPVGAHESGLIGESPQGIPNNLMPYIVDVALKKRSHLNLYGNDYPTPDGTGVRDYIHVVDLANAHVLAIEKPLETINIYNVGTSKGISVLEMIQAFEKVNQVKVPYSITKRRDGDIAVSYADASKIKKMIGFEAKKTLEDMVKDSYHFAVKNHG